MWRTVSGCRRCRIHRYVAAPMTHFVTFWDGCVFTALYMTEHQKALCWWPWPILPRSGGWLAKKQNCIKCRPFYRPYNNLLTFSRKNPRVTYLLKIFSSFVLWAVRLWKPQVRLDLGSSSRGLKSTIQTTPHPTSFCGWNFFSGMVSSASSHTALHQSHCKIIFK